MVQSTTVIATALNNMEYIIKVNLDCRSKYTKYVITCKHCGQQYVGSTTLELRKRYSNHKCKIRKYITMSLMDIAKKDGDHEALIKHFRGECGQKLDILNNDNFITIQPIDQIQIPKGNNHVKNQMIIETKLNEKERFWQTYFNAIHVGLNGGKDWHNTGHTRRNTDKKLKDEWYSKHCLRLG